MYGSGCRVVVSRELGTAGTRVPASVPSRGDKGGRQVPRFVSMGNRSPLTPDGDNDLAALPIQAQGELAGAEDLQALLAEIE